jgi:hypothetical protein
MYWIVFLESLIIFLMILHIAWLWEQIHIGRKSHEPIVSGGTHEGLNWGVPTANVNILHPTESLFVNLEIGGSVYRVYRVKVISTKSTSVTLETTTWNHPVIQANTVEE